VRYFSSALSITVSQTLERRDVAISRRLYELLSCRGLRLDLEREYDGSSDGRSAIACRQASQRRFCRRSQLWNTASQRRQVVGPAYDVSFVGFTLRRGGCRLMVILCAERLIGTGHVSALTPYRPSLLRTEGRTPFAQSMVHIRIGHFWIHHPQ
jgi:hypothetical protein